MTADTLRLNVFLRAPAAFDARLEALAAAVERGGVAPFRRSGRLGHVTLLLASFPRDAVHEVEARVAHLLADALAVRLCARAVRASGDWLFLDLANSSALLALNEALARALAPLRDPDAPLPEHARGKPELSAAFARFGSTRVGATFRPHLSLAHAPAPALAAITQQLGQAPAPSQPLTAWADQVGIGEADDDGQVRAPLRTWTLLPRD